MSHPANTPASPLDEPLRDAPTDSDSDKPEAPEKEQSAPALDVKALTDQALQFLATASNETLGGCLLALGAGTYLVLGRVGLLLIGVVGGVVLHATWEGQAHGPDGENNASDKQARRRELGVDVAHRILDWRGKNTDSNSENTETDVRLYTGKELDFSAFQPETAAALTELTDAIIRDYVKWWYSPILPSEHSFPSSCRQTLTAFLISVSNHLSRKRPADNFVDFVTRSSSFMIIIFQELSAAIMASPGDTPAEAVDIYLNKKRDSTLANILDTEYQMKQFSVASEDILQNYLDPKTYNCKPAGTFLHQILAKVVLEMIVVSCAKPEWINGWIVYLLEDGEPELMNAIDAGVEGSAEKMQNVVDRIEQKEEAKEGSMSPEAKQHKRVVSRAQDAMDEAMREAQRMNQMIAEEDAKRLKEQQRNQSNSTLNDDKSENTTQGIVTPTSSQSETLADTDATEFSTQASSHIESPSPTKMPEEPPKPESRATFTSFDQLVPQQPPTALMSNPSQSERPPPLTLHNARMSIFDDAMPGEKGTIKNKPTAEYLIQIEPSSQHHSGWMTARKYTDFETLHEVLRRIAAITGATGFAEAHAALPHWKGHTKASLRGELERYLSDAATYKPLAESEGMKRFLEKELGSGKSPGSKGFPGIGWPGQTFETMGKGMIDVLSKAPKEVAGGGKAFFGGVSGVMGSIATPLGGGAKKNRDSVTTPINESPGGLPRAATTPTPPVQNRPGRAESTVSELPTHIRTDSAVPHGSRRTSTESLRNPNSPIVDQQPAREAPMERRPSYNPDGDGKRSKPSSLVSGSRSNSRAPSVRESMDLSPVMGGDQILNLPPAPSDIPDDYTGSPPRISLDPNHTRQQSRASTNSLPLSPLDQPPVPPLPRRPSAISMNSSSQIPTTSTTQSKQAPQQQTPPKAPTKPSHTPLTEQETTVLIELFFALTQELYTLSSAWNIRRMVLTTAKTFLLRPGNPQLTSIQTLLQQTVLDANTSDAGLAYHLRKVRANALPTEEELKTWPKEMSADEKERLRVKARKLAVERGMPQALTSVMGMAASGEAVGKVFDALQEGRVARGMVFGLVLQGLRALTQ